MTKLTSAMLTLAIFPIGSILIGDTARATETGTGHGDGRSHLPSRPCSSSNTATAPADGLIADFNDAGGGAKPGGIEIWGEVLTYAVPKLGGAGSTISTTTGGALTIKVSAAPASTPQFLGALVSFNKCIDASGFTGVQFTISGSFFGCTMQYATGDVEHQDITVGSTFATGPAGSYPPQNRIAADDLTSAPRTIKVPFVGNDIQGSPRTRLDTTRLISTLWQFSVPVAAEDGDDNPLCTGSVTIDDVKFYH